MPPEEKPVDIITAVTAALGILELVAEAIERGDTRLSDEQRAEYREMHSASLNRVRAAAERARERREADA
jgi:hypothetical protein